MSLLLGQIVLSLKVTQSIQKTEYSYQTKGKKKKKRHLDFSEILQNEISSQLPESTLEQLK